MEATGQPASLNEWMRVVRNLAVNSEIERPEEYSRSLIAWITSAFQWGDTRAPSDADVGPIGFSPQQVREEALKAKLILADTSWRDCIDRAEEHGYFSGQIEFLLDFCGVLSKEMLAKWDGTEHARLQTSFDEYFTKAQITFTSSGLALTKDTCGREHYWHWRLSSFFGSNYSFLTDPQRNWDSWKRFPGARRDGNCSRFCGIAST